MSGEATSPGLPLPFFVYGTLMQGQPNAYVWQDSIQRVESAQFLGGRLFDFWFYPMMVACRESLVIGELVWIRPDCFAQILGVLDRLEGYDPQGPVEDGFRRVQRLVLAQESGVVVAWTYLGDPRLARERSVVESGDWAKHASGRQA